MKDITNEAVMEPPEKQEQALVAVANETGIQKETADSLLHIFAPMASEARAIIKQADGTTNPKLARAFRLGLREIRSKIEDARKKFKENSLREGKAIDGMANILKFIIEPVEKQLSDVEHAAEIADAKRKADLKLAREAQLKPFGISVEFYQLGEMSDESFLQLLENTKAAHDAKIEAQRKTDEARIATENARLKEEARIREENQRLQLEAIKRDAQLKAEREQAEAAAKEAALKAATEQAEIERKARAEREAVEKKAKVAADKAAKERAALEAKAKNEREAAEKVAREERAAREKLEKEIRERNAADAAKEAAQVATKARAERAPDKEKLKAFRQEIAALQIPSMATPAGKRAALIIQTAITEAAETIEIAIGAL